MSERYSIVRFFNPHPPYPHPKYRPSEVMQTGLTLDEAQEHCQRDDTREDGIWFDGYREE